MALSQSINIYPNYVPTDQISKSKGFITSVLMSTRTNSNINISVYNASEFIVQIATTVVGQIVTCSFQRMIDTINAIAAPVNY